jgi:hypothetical protein
LWLLGAFIRPNLADFLVLMSRATYIVEIEMRELHTICELPRLRLRASVEALLHIAPPLTAPPQPASA